MTHLEKLKQKEHPAVGRIIDAIREHASNPDFAIQALEAITAALKADKAATHEFIRRQTAPNKLFQGPKDLDEANALFVLTARTQTAHNDRGWFEARGITFSWAWTGTGLSICLEGPTGRHSIERAQWPQIEPHILGYLQNQPDYKAWKSRQGIGPFGAAIDQEFKRTT